MAASEKTAVLGLSRWKGTDKPRREDFVSDNDALEEKVGGHMRDAALHLNTERAARLDTPFEVRTYTGNGAAQRAVMFSFAPRMAAAFALGKATSVAESGYTKQYAALATAEHAGGGLKLNSIQVLPQQDQSAPGAGGTMFALNESGVEYLLIALR